MQGNLADEMELTLRDETDVSFDSVQSDGNDLLTSIVLSCKAL